MFLQVKKIVCRYGKETVIRDLSFTIGRGEQACLLGPSGCGKTTVLRAIAGFQNLSDGSIVIDGNLSSSKSTNTPPEERRLGMVFQDHALFPHMNVEENIQVGIRSLPPVDRNSIADYFLERMSLERERKKYPHELSGGQAQRVALARALSPKPLLMLMDEPFSGLDFDLRERMNIEVADLLRSQGTTCLMVTHDQNDAFAFGRQIGVMRSGELEQWATPHQVYHEPRSKFVADFIGSGVFLSGRVINHKTIHTDYVDLESIVCSRWSIGTKLEVLIRPDDIIYDPSSDLKVDVRSKAFKGSQTLYTLGVDGKNSLLALFPSHENFSIGDSVNIRFKVDHVVAYPL